MKQYRIKNNLQKNNRSLIKEKKKNNGFKKLCFKQINKKNRYRTLFNNLAVLIAKKMLGK
jgi:hypothetical protein